MRAAGRAPNWVGGRQSIYRVLIAEALALIAVFAAISTLPAGMLTAHMLAHIVVMTLLAPVAALALLGFNKRRNRRLYAPLAAWLAPATLLQLALFSAMHAPLLISNAMHAPQLRPLLTLLLFAVALLFWMSVIASARSGRASSIAALLLTGKVLCLLAALMVFSDRVVFGHGILLPDQHAAGLAMLIACPLAYVGASVVIVAKWLSAMSQPAQQTPA